MAYSSKFATVKKYYSTIYKGERMWSAERVANAVVKGWITAEEYEEITGEAYTE